MTKAARDMLHRSIALESEHREGNVKTLNYAPGPMETDMQTEIRNGMRAAESHLSEAFTAMHEQGGLLDPGYSAKKLLRLLAEDDFVSGSHVDVYDLPE